MPVTIFGLEMSASAVGVDGGRIELNRPLVSEMAKSAKVQKPKPKRSVDSAWRVFRHLFA